jgi:hypothetical protein
MHVNVLTFCGGESVFGLASDSVVTVSRPSPGVPHVADILPNLPRGRRSRARSLRLAVNGEPVDLTVDGPLQLVPLSKADIVPTTFRANAIVLGFARVDGNILVLLDVCELVDRLRTKASVSAASDAPVRRD